MFGRNCWLIRRRLIPDVLSRPPSEVIPRHKKRATVIWVFIILLIMSYIVWLFTEVAAKMKNLGVSITIKPDSYEYPTLTMCFVNGGSCDTEDPAYCAANAGVAVITGNGLNSTELEMNSNYANIADVNEVFPNCLEIRLNEVSQDEPLAPVIPGFILLEVAWNADVFGNATVDVVFQVVDIFFTDPRFKFGVDHRKSVHVGEISYNRIYPGEDVRSLRVTSVALEMTDTIDLSQESTRTYSASSILETDIRAVGDLPLAVHEVNETHGVVLLKVSKPRLSYTVRKEIHPLEWAEIFGNIGGCWELLLMLWGMLFVTVGTGEPRLEGRNFTSTKKRAVESVRVVALGMRSIASSSRIGQTPSTPVQGPDRNATHSRDKEDRSNTEGEAIPRPAFNPATSGSSPHPVPRLPSQLKRESDPPPKTLRNSGPYLSGMFRRQRMKSNGSLSSTSFRSSFGKVSADLSDANMSVEASTARPVPCSFPMPSGRNIETKKRKFRADES